MDNHVHLLINEGIDKISRIMKRINVSYAYYFNKKYGRIGHLYQDRFRSEAIEDDGYLLAAVRYVHNNPVKVGIVSHPSDYKWSSYGLYTNAGINESCTVNVDFILEMFSSDRNKAMELFKEYSVQESDDSFIEYQSERKTDKTIQNEQEASLVISDYLRENSLYLDDLKKPINAKLRCDLIVKLKSNSSLSVRQIAKIVDLNRNIVQRAM
jgi:putative transposase